MIVLKHIFSRGDVNGFWALFADNLANLLIIISVCRFVFKMPDEIILGRIVPGLGTAIIVGMLAYAYMAYRLAKKENRTDVTALPYGISTPIMFVYLFGVIGPIYWATSDPLLAWQVGIAAGLIGGLVEVLGSVVGPWLKKVIPRAGMLGTLSGIALTFIATMGLAHIYESPLIGFASLAIVLWGLVGRFKLPFDLPAGLVAIVVGTGIALIIGKSSISLEGIGIYLPSVYFNDLLEGIRHLFNHPELLAVLIPIQIYNFIETMNNVESAESAGDKYPVHICQIMDGVGTTAGALFGSPFPTTVYIGHPAYKSLGAHSGYTLGVGLVFFLGAMFGFIAFLGNLIPAVVVAPILVYVGISIIASSFQVCPPKHALALAVAFIPHVSSIIVVKWGSVLNALNDMGIENTPKLTDSEFVTAMLTQGASVIGQSDLANGAIISGMLWGAFTAFLIDAKFKSAIFTAIAGAALTAFGIIHAPTLHWPSIDSQVMWGYVIVAALIFLASRVPQEIDTPHG